MSLIKREQLLLILLCRRRRRTATLSGSPGATCRCLWVPRLPCPLNCDPHRRSKGTQKLRCCLLEGSTTMIFLGGGGSGGSMWFKGRKLSAVSRNEYQNSIVGQWRKPCSPQLFTTFTKKWLFPANRPPQRVTGRPPTPKMPKSPAAEDPGNLRPIKISPEIPQPPAPGKTQEAEGERVLTPPPPAEQSKTAQTTRTPPSGEFLVTRKGGFDLTRGDF